MKTKKFKEINYCIICKSRMHILYPQIFDNRYGALGYYSISICNKCNFGRLSPTLKRSQIGEIYKRYYPLSRMTVQTVKSSINKTPKLLSWLMGINNSSHLYIRSQSEVLDVGSASGVSLLEIKKNGANGFGVEPDPSAQKIAKKLGLNVHKGFITDNPFPNKKFDYVTGSQVIEHDPDPYNFLISMKRKLNNNGLIILSTPNTNSLYRKVFGKNWINWHVPYHLNFFTHKSFEILSKRTGLKIESFRTITPNIWTVMQIRSLFIKNEMGERNKLWNTSKIRWSEKILNIFLFILVLPFNRLIDYMGLGDSILIFMSNEK